MFAFEVSKCITQSLYFCEKIGTTAGNNRCFSVLGKYYIFLQSNYTKQIIKTQKSICKQATFSLCAAKLINQPPQQLVHWMDRSAEMCCHRRV